MRDLLMSRFHEKALRTVPTILGLLDFVQRKRQEQKLVAVKHIHVLSI
jgi:hypothetical protein